MEGEGQPEFSYSIGIEKTLQKPEIVIVGLKSTLANSIINNYNNRVRAGEIIEPGRYYQDFLEGFDVCLIEVDKKHYMEFFGWGLWLYSGDNFRVLQLIWPTIEGVWPWDVNKSEFYQWAQPILNASGILNEI